ncbi:hypothetical protein BC829DRAFT_448846 [Chytridium lagenaria]|nr:hypothetical protein BC829DRAFT_448846 [Chytridium lagenaria]
MPPAAIPTYIKSTPYLTFLVSAVSVAALTGGWLMSHRIRNDPNVVIFNRKENPFPWLQVDQGTNLKLYAVHRKFEKEKK